MHVLAWTAVYSEHIVNSALAMYCHSHAMLVKLVHRALVSTEEYETHCSLRAKRDLGRVSSSS